MKVALPISSFLPSLGGMEIGLHNIALQLLEQGIIPVIMAPWTHTKSLAQSSWSLPYTVESYPPKIWSILQKFPKCGFKISNAFFAYMQRKYRFDFWHCTMGYPTGCALINFATTRDDIKYLIRCAGHDIQKCPDIGYGARLDPTIDAMVTKLLPQAQALTAISHSVVDEYKKLGVAPEKIHLIPNGVDLSRFAMRIDKKVVRESLGISNDSYVFISVGRNHPKKNYLNLVKACKLLANKTNSFKIILIGKGVTDLQKNIADLQLTQYFILKESNTVNQQKLTQVPQFPADTIIKFLKAADAFVFPSLVETFGIAIIEAMAAGLPVIVGDSPGCRDVVEHGKYGVLVNPVQVQDISQAMLSFMYNQDLAKKYSAKSLIRSKNFSWEKIVKQYIDLYTSV